MRTRIMGITLLMVCALLGACGTGEAEAPAAEANEMTANQTAILTEDCTATECGSETTSEEGQTAQRIDMEDQALKAGDLVLVTEVQDNTAIVSLPGGDAPWLSGKLPVKVLSQDPDQLQTANQANAKGVMGYDQIDGQEIEEFLGLVYVLERQDAWCKVQAIGGGSDTTLWVRAADLSYNLA